MSALANNSSIIQKIIISCFGSRNQRVLKQLYPKIQLIRENQQKFSTLSDEELKNLTVEFKQKLKNGATLDDILAQAFAAVIEASKRTIGLEHYDEQLIGGIILKQGKIAEMKTGEGKTLASTLPAYLHSLMGKGVHIITVNPYLAERDCQWMSPIYEALGVSVGVILPNMDFSAKKQAYQADITYGTNNEFGFDYLRDNMAQSIDHLVQRERYFAIIDEVDSVLIDEARTPLIISGEAEEDLNNYPVLNKIAKTLLPGEDLDADFTIDEKEKNIVLTEKGHQTIEDSLVKNNILTNNSGGLYDVTNISLLHTMTALLKAHHLFQKNVHYIIKDNQIVIIDEHTGRSMPGRRWSDGIHQAIEVKENLPIQKESVTLASITFQNYFRMYDVLSGMTGTADTEAQELHQIYNLEVVIIPSHKPIQRLDLSDRMYLNSKGKFDAILQDIQQRHETKQPILVGTASIEVSEHLSDLLTKASIPHQLLNAKQNDKEAQIISQAGCLGAVTIATNMAGRGTDIELGGSLQALLTNTDDSQKQEVINNWKKDNQAVKSLGGLHILGTERHESRRIDNQLRGRAGRQGDPGSSQFYLSLDDSLMRIFASPKVKSLMQKVGMQENETLEHPILTRQIEGAQRKVEGFNFDIRKQLLKFDNVANEQRTLIYTQRHTLLTAESIVDNIQNILELVVDNLVNNYLPAESFADQWEVDDLTAVLRNEFAILCTVQAWIDSNTHITQHEIKQKIIEKFKTHYQSQEQKFSTEVIRRLEIIIMLKVLDQYWHEHLTSMEHLREGIHLRGYAQKDPTEEYRKESFELFKSMLFNIKKETLSVLMRAEPTTEEQVDVSKVSRNQLCPCNSGKKYKHCHGAVIN
jgi:preprotein translocase subunit SecA